MKNSGFELESRRGKGTTRKLVAVVQVRDDYKCSRWQYLFTFEYHQGISKRKKGRVNIINSFNR